jgi:hypothetical protein
MAEPQYAPRSTGKLLICPPTDFDLRPINGMRREVLAERETADLDTARGGSPFNDLLAASRRLR